MLPSEHAAAIVAHYLRALTERSGLRWTAANDRDMDILASLLDQVNVAPELASIPPFEMPIVNDRVTQVFEREPIPVDPEWEKFQRWRQVRAEEERDSQVRRMVNR